MSEESGAKDLPLSGKRIVVTRARAQAGRLASALEDLGAEIIEFPAIEVRADDSPPPPSLNHFDWIVFTSANGVHFFADKAEKSDLGSARICAVGPATADAARSRGLSVDLVPDEYVAEATVHALVQEDQSLDGKRILLPRGNIARELLPVQLRDLGAAVTEWIVYETALPDVSEQDAEKLVNAHPNLVTFTSASTAQNFCALLGPERLERLKMGAAFVSIGPLTTEAAEAQGLTISAQPDKHDVPGLVDSLVRWVKAK